MSRSIHTTWRKIFEERRWNYDVEQKRERIAGLKRDIFRKRAIKDASDKSSDEVFAADVDSMPSIVVRTKSDLEHFPASTTDIENIIAKLPRGTVDGIKQITLSTGMEVQAEYADFETVAEEDYDPHIGRIGSECWPGVYAGSILGQYYEASNDVYIYSYVYKSEIPFKPIAELYLRCHMLSTLVHELAHHNDLREANHRGKWHLTKAVRENFAVRHACDWTQDYIIPYVKHHYGKECQEFEDWIEQYGGIKVPIDQFFVDRFIIKDLNLFNISIRAEMLDYSIEALARSVIDDELPKTRQLRFATDLRIGRRLDYAQPLTEKLLEQYPGDAKIIVESAKQLEDRSEFEKAEGMLKPLLSTEHRLECAFILCRIYARQKRWTELLSMAEPGVRDAETWRAVAFFKLDHLREFEELREQMASRSVSSARRLDSILKEYT